MKKQGFTLIEMIIALGIFSFVLIIYIGLYGRFITAQREGNQVQVVLEQVRTAFEVMDREIRTGFGSTYVVADGAGAGVLFRNQNGDCVYYRWENDTVERAEAAVGGVDCTTSDFSGAAFTQLVGSDVQVSHMRFDATTANEINGSLDNQGFITIIAVVNGTTATSVPTSFQSSITSRQVIPYVES